MTNSERYRSAFSHVRAPSGCVQQALEQASSPQNAQHEADHKSGDNNAGDTIGLEKLDSLNNGPADHGDQCGDRRALHNVKRNFHHTQTLPFFRSRQGFWPPPVYFLYRKDTKYSKEKSIFVANRSRFVTIESL